MKKFEFSKMILCMVMATYFVALIFGMVVIYRLVGYNSSYSCTAICGLFSYVGAPVAVAIGFYSYKAKAENIEKIKNNVDFSTTSYKDETDDVRIDITEH